MELRPFRALRYSPRILFERGLSSLIAPPSESRSPEMPTNLAEENIARLLWSQSAEGGMAAAAETMARWIADGVLLHERRPGLWIYRQVIPREGDPLVIAMLVGLVRLGKIGDEVGLAPTSVSIATRDERIALRRALRADFEPSLLLTRAPLAGALATTRQPDLSAEDRDGVRHDAFRIHDYAQHVELQGLVKNADLILAEGRDLWGAALAFESDPEAAKLPGARFKLCAILDEIFLDSSHGEAPPSIASGFFAVSLQDPVY